jgi:hypothetical protein
MNREDRPERTKASAPPRIAETAWPSDIRQKPKAVTAE